MKGFNVRRLVAVAAAALVGLSAAACSNDTPGNTGPGPLPTDSVTITFAWWGNDARKALMDQVIAEFNKTYPYIHVEGQSVGAPNDLFTRLQTQMAAQSGVPDVITLGGAWPLKLASAGNLLKLSDVSTDLDSTKFPASILPAATYDGDLYGVPTGSNAYGIAVNPDLFTAAGVSLPNDDSWTWADFQSIATQIHQKTPAVAGAETRLRDLLGTYATQQGNPLFDEKGNLTITADTLTKLFTMEKTLFDAGALPAATDITASAGQAPEKTAFGQGKSAMIVIPANQLSSYDKVLGGKNSLKLLRIPGEEDKANSKRRGVTLVPSQFFSIYSGSKYPRQAATFINFMLNTVDAGKIVTTNRGLPTNPTVADAIASSFSPMDKAYADYVKKVGALDSPATPPSPANATTIEPTTDKADESLLLGGKTPAQAAQTWLDTIKSDMAKAAS
jgi:multiple sugar transport system substrate-binding protein